MKKRRQGGSTYDAPPVLHHVKATVEFDDDEDDVVFIGRKVQRRKW